LLDAYNVDEDKKTQKILQKKEQEQKLLNAAKEQPMFVSGQ
jgi:hypothetical protein